MITTNYLNFIDKVNENATVDIINDVMKNIQNKSKEINNKLKEFSTKKTADGIVVEKNKVYFTLLKYKSEGENEKYNTKDIIFRVQISGIKNAYLEYKVLNSQVDGAKASIDNINDVNKGKIYAYQLVATLENIAKLFADDHKREELTDDQKNKLKEGKEKILEKGKKYQYTSSKGDKITIIVKNVTPEGKYQVANVDKPDSLFIPIMKNVGNEV